MGAEPKRFFAAQAWVQGAWAHDVLLAVDASGHWCGVQPDASVQERVGASVLGGPVLPGLVNAHSHAFQRAMAGLTERCDSAGVADDFWSWRDRMYSVANRITPDQLETIAAQLYAELLAAGYTQVCEFHYLHHGVLDAPSADPLEMSLALVRAAQRVGMGLTLLPTLYMRSGFGASGLREDQRRFASTPDSVLRLVDAVQRHTTHLDLINVGVAVHSLRAVDEVALHELASAAASAGLPVHIHVAEQEQEVRDCVQHTGARPIEWLLSKLPLDAHWNLVHATHTTPSELQGVRTCGAAIVICPSTEANLGDGVFDYSGWARLGGRWSIGSDSHVTRAWTEELRLLEYSQRLTQRRRNVAAAPGVQTSSAAVLFEGALAGGRNATALPLGSIAVGNRADFLVLPAHGNALLGLPASHLLDAWVFSSPQPAGAQVFVAGQGRAGVDPQIQQAFARTMHTLWH